MGLDRLQSFWLDIVSEWEDTIKWRLFLRKHGAAYFKKAKFEVILLKIGNPN
jgi:hypothetical protein